MIVQSNSARKVLKVFEPCRIWLSLQAALSADSVSLYAAWSWLRRPSVLIASVPSTDVTQELICTRASPLRRLCTYQNCTSSVSALLSIASFALACINHSQNSDLLPLNSGSSGSFAFCRTAICGCTSSSIAAVVVLYDEDSGVVVTPPF